MREDEITDWVAGCQHQLLRLAYLLTGDIQRAEDLVQEALVKVALRWERLRDEQPTAYARTVVMRDHVSWWRRHGRETRGAAPERPAEAPATEDQMVVRRALARLTPAQRKVVILRHFADLTERETADVLGVSVGTVKSQNAAALTRLRDGAPELLDLIGRKR